MAKTRKTEEPPANSGDAKPAIYLLDSMSFIFRAYHAMQRQRPMSTRKGVPTAATYVFINMLRKLLADFSPQFVGAVYDVSAPLLRDARAKEFTAVKKFNIKTQKFEDVEYAGYKANRAEMPADLAQQLPYIRRALDAFHIPVLFYEGYEADDVIGTLARQASEAGYPVYVVSNDKDMMQLVTETVHILNPAKDNLVLDEKKVEEVLGVPPARVIDVMALRGDAIDNIPGAPGIGEKGSVELIQQFGTVEGALDRAAEVKRKTYRESLENNRANILLSKELVTIHCSVPIDLELDKLRVRETDYDAARDLYTELEFTTLLKDLGGPSATSKAPTVRVDYIVQPTELQITEVLRQAKESGLAIAFELRGSAAAEAALAEEQGEQLEQQNQAMMLDFSAAPVTVRCAPSQTACLWAGIAATPAQSLRVNLLAADGEALRNALADGSLPKRVHDSKAVLRAAENAKMEICGIAEDVMLYSYLQNPTHASHTLADIAARTASAPLSRQGEEAVLEQAAAIAQLAPLLREQAVGSDTLKVYEQIDLPLCPVLLRMERAGVRIDLDVLADLSRRLTNDMAVLGEKIFEVCCTRFNINSPKQLGDVLFNKMGLPKPLKYGKGKVISTAQDVLEELSQHHAAPRMVLEYRGLAKLKSNYIDALPLLADSDGRVHTTFNQVGTATGRLSSTAPNLQNIPVKTALGREIRAAFIPAPGNVFLSADYSQIELRLLAHFSQDPLLLEAYRTGQDIHTLTASEVFQIPPEQLDKQTRDRAKAINFGIVYGISAFGLAQQNIGIDQHEARVYIERYFERYAGVRKFIDEILNETRKTQQVRTMFGRVRPIPDILSSNANMRGFAERTAVNTPLQGTAADLIKVAMIKLDAEMAQRKMRSRMTLQVHDELIFDAVPDEVEELSALVRREMEHAAEISVPLVADVGVGPNWRDLQ
jgi:DNA polymerase-1